MVPPSGSDGEDNESWKYCLGTHIGNAMLLVWIIIAAVSGSVLSVAGAALILFLSGEVRKSLVSLLVSYATGTLLGAAFLGMLPHALEYVRPPALLGTVLAGIVFFFLVEKLVIWRHCHNGGCQVHGTAGPLILFGDAFHNFVDGVVIATAFLVSIPLGVTTALAVIAHEVPQEVGDFAILLDGGYSKRKALAFNILSSVATFPGAIIAYCSLEAAQGIVPYVLAISAASFIYIAIADLIPTLHQRVGIKVGISQFVLLMAGIGTILIFQNG